MSGYNLPDGCTEADIDRAWGDGDPRDVEPDPGPHPCPNCAEDMDGEGPCPECNWEWVDPEHRLPADYP